MKTKFLHQSGGLQTVRNFQTHRVNIAEQRAVRGFLKAKELTPHSRLSLSSPNGRVVVRVLSADEIEKRRKLGRQITVLGKMEEVTPQMAVAQARRAVAMRGAVKPPIADNERPLIRKTSRLAGAALGHSLVGGVLAAIGHGVVASCVSHTAVSPQVKELYAVIETMKNCIATLEKKVDALAETNHNSDGIQPFNIFNPIIDENKLADCFYGIYHHFFDVDGKKNTLEQCDDERFAAYLFILVEKERLGGENFSSRCQMEFRKYLKAKVIIDGLTKHPKTFNNRLNEMDNLRSQKGSKDTAQSADFDLRNFQKVIDVFQNTRYYFELSKLKRK